MRRSREQQADRFRESEVSTFMNTIANATTQPHNQPAQNQPAQDQPAQDQVAQDPVATAAEYAGDLDPRAAWDLLARESDAALVDCRSRAEWTWVGTPDLASLGKRAIPIEWQRWTERGMQPNPDFARELAAAGVAPAQA